MSTRDKPLTTAEIDHAFADGTGQAVPPILGTKEAARLLGVKPKTLDLWKNGGRLDGTYIKRGGRVFYWRDRLVAHIFNDNEMNDDQKQKAE